MGVRPNGYYARNVEAGIRVPKPLAEMGVKGISISNDSLHYKNPRSSSSMRALEAAKK